MDYPKEYKPPRVEELMQKSETAWGEICTNGPVPGSGADPCDWGTTAGGCTSGSTPGAGACTTGTLAS